VAPERIYRDYREMMEREAALPLGERMDFVAIVTPNRVHYEQAAMALDMGFDVVLDKPMTFSLDEALRLEEKVRQTGRTLALTHTYSAYPAIKEMKSRIAEGQLGRLRLVYVEYT
jgi:predicted dehydrogenase